MRRDRVDALVIGAGVGGLCTAARLAAGGMRVRVVERLSILGGRFSTRTLRGCKVTTGAIMVPFGERSAFQEAFSLLKAPFSVREGKGGFRYRLPHGEYAPPAEGGGGLLGMLAFALEDEDAARALFRHFKRGLAWWEPSDALSFSDWLSQYTRHPAVHRLLDGFCAAFVGVHLHEVPAGEYFRFLKAMGRNNRYGIAVDGNRALMESLGGAVEEAGGRVDTRTRCKGILVEEGRVRGAVVECGGEQERVEAQFVVSNVGPRSTVRLAGEGEFDRSYVALLDRHPHVTPVVHVCLRSTEPLDPFPGITNFGNTRRLVFLECPTLTCPELAPPGVHITTTFSVPAASVPPVPSRATIEEIMVDLEENLPSFRRKEHILTVTVHQGEWPAMRRWPGHPMPVRTPVENLFNVGDGCMPPGTVGVEACARSAKAVAGEILSGG